MTQSQIDVVVDHFKAMGYAAGDVCRAIATLVEMRADDGPAAWSVLEEAPYHLVQEKLMDMEEEKQRQNQLLLKRRRQEPNQEQGPALDKAPPEIITEAEILANDKVTAQQQETVVDKAPLDKVEAQEQGPALDKAPPEIITEAEILANDKVTAQQQETAVDKAPLEKVEAQQQETAVDEEPLEKVEAQQQETAVDKAPLEKVKAQQKEVKYVPTVRMTRSRAKMMRMTTRPLSR